MPDVPETCVALNGGAECVAEATMTEPVLLCDEHQLQIAVSVATDVLVTAYRQAQAGAAAVTLPPDERAAVIAGAQPRDIGSYLGGAHSTIVYFAENGDRVKIGQSTNLRQRVKSLSLQEKNVALALQGGRTLERALHAHFAKERIDSTEWFAKSERLMAFIRSKQDALGGQHQRKVQHQQRKRIVPPAQTAQRPPTQWATLAAPLYRKFVAEHHGATPSAPILASLLRNAHPDLKVPASERSERIIRAATEALIAAEGGRS